MLRLVDEVGSALDRTAQLLPDDFPGHVWDTIAAGMRRHADRFRAGLRQLGDDSAVDGGLGTTVVRARTGSSSTRLARGPGSS